MSPSPASPALAGFQVAAPSTLLKTPPFVAA
jgi:hypothetical protein